MLATRTETIPVALIGLPQVHERAGRPDPAPWLIPGVAGMLTPRTAVMSDVLSRVHASGIVTEAPRLEFDVGLVEDADAECVVILGAAQLEPHALNTKPSITTHRGSVRFNTGLNLPPAT